MSPTTSGRSPSRLDGLTAPIRLAAAAVALLLFAGLLTAGPGPLGSTDEAGKKYGPNSSHSVQGGKKFAPAFSTSVEAGKQVERYCMDCIG